VKQSKKQGGIMKIQDWKTLNELAEILKVKKSWLYGQTFKKGPGSLPRLKIGKHLRFDLEAVERWILKRNEN
jgi:predicted DNA-binding transcriptional regulator AlpA